MDLGRLPPPPPPPQRQQLTIPTIVNNPQRYHGPSITDVDVDVYASWTSPPAPLPQINNAFAVPPALNGVVGAFGPFLGRNVMASSSSSHNNIMSNHHMSNITQQSTMINRYTGGGVVMMVVGVVVVGVWVS
jgi:hypothetical protein